MEEKSERGIDSGGRKWGSHGKKVGMKLGSPRWRGKKMEGWMGIGKMEEIGNTINRRDKEAACLISSCRSLQS